MVARPSFFTVWFAVFLCVFVIVKEFLCFGLLDKSNNLILSFTLGLIIKIICRSINNGHICYCVGGALTRLTEFIYNSIKEKSIICVFH